MQHLRFRDIPRRQEFRQGGLLVMVGDHPVGRWTSISTSRNLAPGQCVDEGRLADTGTANEPNHQTVIQAALGLGNVLPTPLRLGAAWRRLPVNTGLAEQSEAMEELEVQTIRCVCDASQTVFRKP